MHESAAALPPRMQSEKDGKKRQRLHALSLVASGQARYRQDIAPLRGGHRHSGAAGWDASAEGGLAQALCSHVPTPPVHRRIPDTALTALQAKLQEPHGVAGSDQIRRGLAKAPQVALAYSSVQALVRSRLHATPKRPRPSHGKKVQQP
jgi:hypothetical protein